MSFPEGRGRRSALHQFGFACAFISAMLIFVPTALTSVGFLFGLAVSPVVYVVGAIVGLLSAFMLTRELRTFLIVLGVIALSCLAFYLLLSTTIDLSPDSLSYHTRAIESLAQGYNPVKETHEVPWVQYYPQGSWVFQAGIFQLTGNMESTSIINLLGLFVAFGCSLMFVSRVKVMPKYVAATVILCSVFAPIATVQLTTHYVDGFFGSLAVGSIWIIAGYMLGILNNKENKLQILLGTLMLLMSLTKFTGFVFSCILLAAYFIYLFMFSRESGDLRRYVIFCGALLGILLIVSYSPYGKNILEHANPFYPILSSDIHSFVDAPDERNRPLAYKTVNPVSGLWMSLTEQAGGKGRGYHPKFPLRVYKSEVQSLGGPDTALGGNGPLFFLSIIIGAFGYAYFLLQKDISKKRKIVSALLIGGVLVCTLAMIDTWWARLVPFLIALPLLFLVIISSKINIPILRISSILLSLVLLGNSGIILYSTAMKIQENQSTKRALEHYFADTSPTYFRFDPDAIEIVKVSLRRIMKELGSNATEMPQAIPSGQITFIDDVTGDKQTRFIYSDDPPANQEDIKNTWEHVVKLQALFTFIKK